MGCTSLLDHITLTYGKKLLSVVKSMFKHIHDAEQMSSHDFHSGMQKAKATIQRIAIHEAQSCINEVGKEELNHEQNMANRFRHHGKAYFQIMITPDMDPTKNRAKQGIHFIIIDRYVTQGTRRPKDRQVSERL